MAKYRRRFQYLLDNYVNKLILNISKVLDLNKTNY